MQRLAQAVYSLKAVMNSACAEARCLCWLPVHHFLFQENTSLHNTALPPPPGNAFPILGNSRGKALAAAGRTDGGGRAVAFTREAFMNSDTDATLMTGPIGRYLANVVRWASGTTGSTVRVAGPNGGPYTTTQGIANLNLSAVSALFHFSWPAGHSLPQHATACTARQCTSYTRARKLAFKATRPGPSHRSTKCFSLHPATQASLGYSFVPPTGSAGYSLSSPTGLLVTSRRRRGLLATTRTADVWMNNAGSSYTDAEIAALQDFLRAGGGIIMGHQAWCAAFDCAGGGKGRGLPHQFTPLSFSGDWLWDSNSCIPCAQA